MLDWRLKAFRNWQTMPEPNYWANLKYPKVDYQNLVYYSAPKPKNRLASLDEVDPEMRRTFEKLGISLDEQKRLSGVAVDAVFDSVSVATTFRETLGELGIIFCSFSEAVQKSSRAGQEVSRLGGALQRQLLRRPQRGGLQRRLLRLHSQGGALSDGAVDLFPHQCQGNRPVRAHADHRRGGRLRQLSRRLHRPDPRREPTARRRG